MRTHFEPAAEAPLDWGFAKNWSLHWMTDQVEPRPDEAWGVGVPYLFALGELNN